MLSGFTVDQFAAAHQAFARSGFTGAEFCDACRRLPPLTDEELDLLLPWTLGNFIRTPAAAFAAWLRG